MNESKDFEIELKIKLLIVGDSNVGKTSLLLQYTENYYPLQYGATIGIESKIKKFKYKDFDINLQIWDTAGQERFHSITNGFFRNADGILFVYDITENKSFEGIKVWIKEAEELGDSFKRILIGNKFDLKEKRNVKKEDIEKFCLENNLNYFETSAKENINIKDVFNKMIELLFEDKSNEEIIREFGIKKSSLSVASKRTVISNKNKDKKVKCC